MLTLWQDLSCLRTGIPILCGIHSRTWSRKDCKLHISCLEFKAASMALNHWVHYLAGNQGIVAMDNTKVESYFNKQVGLGPPSASGKSRPIPVVTFAGNSASKPDTQPGCLK